MEEMAVMPARVQNGDEGMEVYEYEGGFAMTTEFLGKLLGFKRPKEQLSRLLRRHKSALEPHLFSVAVAGNPGSNKLRLNATYSRRGRPSFFYDLRGCERAAAFAQTPQANEVYVRISELRARLEARRMERIESYWFERRPFWPEVRERVMRGETFRAVAEAMDRSTASVRNAVRRMIEVGIMLPLRAAQALTGRARRTVLDYGRKYYAPRDDRQMHLPGL